MLLCKNRQGASYVFSQRMASLPPQWAARLKILGENATGISLSSSLSCVALQMCSADNELAFSFAPISGKSSAFWCNLSTLLSISCEGVVQPLNKKPLTLHSTFSAISPHAGHGPRPAEEGSPFLFLKEWDFHSCKVVFPRRLVCILLYSIWFSVWIYFISEGSSPKPVPSRGLSDGKQTEWLAGGMGSHGQCCFTCIAMCEKLCKSNENWTEELLLFLLQENHGGRYPDNHCW